MKLLSALELAGELNVSEDTIARWEKSGRIQPMIRAGRVVRYNFSDVIKALESKPMKRGKIATY